jgi:uroporphyrinogen III methyltransferase/synthase
MQAARLKSLAGVRVLITRSKADNQRLSEKLRELGAVTIELPTIAIIPSENTDLLDDSIRTLSNYDWLIFTSVHGVEFFNKRMTALGKPIGKLHKLKVAAIGPTTATALERLGRKPDYVPPEFLSERIITGLGQVSGKRILLPRADIASAKLPKLLRRRGAIVDEVVAYRTVKPEDLSSDRLQSILQQRVDVVTFTSPSTVRNLAEAAGPKHVGPLLKGVKVACIGPVTAEAARTLGVRVDIVAPNYTIEDLVMAIANEI